jgi:hypothetical protein
MGVLRFGPAGLANDRAKRGSVRRRSSPISLRRWRSCSVNTTATYAFVARRLFPARVSRSELPSLRSARPRQRDRREMQSPHSVSAQVRLSPRTPVLLRRPTPVPSAPHRKRAPVPAATDTNATPPARPFNDRFQSTDSNRSPGGRGSPAVLVVCRAGWASANVARPVDGASRATCLGVTSRRPRSSRGSVRASAANSVLSAARTWLPTQDGRGRW